MSTHLSDFVLKKNPPLHDTILCSFAFLEIRFFLSQHPEIKLRSELSARFSKLGRSEDPQKLLSVENSSPTWHAVQHESYFIRKVFPQKLSKLEIMKSMSSSSHCKLFWLRRQHNFMVVRQIPTGWMWNDSLIPLSEHDFSCDPILQQLSSDTTRSNSSIEKQKFNLKNILKIIFLSTNV